MVTLPDRVVVLLVALLFEEEGQGDSLIVVSYQSSVISVITFSPNVCRYGEHYKLLNLQRGGQSFVISHQSSV